MTAIAIVKVIGPEC